MSPILVMLTSCNDSDFESSNVSLKENKPDGVNPNSNDINYYNGKNEGKILWFSADCFQRNRQMRRSSCNNGQWTRRSYLIFGTFFRDCLQAERFLTPVTSLIEAIRA